MTEMNGRWAAAARRSAARLLTRPAQAEPPTRSGVVLLTSRHRLWQRYGPEGVFAVEGAVGEWMAAAAERGLSGTLVYADDSPLLSRLGLLPPDAGDPAELARLVRGLAERLAWTEETLRHVLILGDDGIIPFHRVANPTLDADTELLSDHPYGARTDHPLLATLTVGRLPDAGLQTLLTGLATATSAHRRLAAGAAPLLSETAFGYSASVWKRAARKVFEAVGEPSALRLSPPLSHRELPAAGPSGPRYHYYNLHGLDDAPEWFGQLDPSFPADYASFPVALRPGDLMADPGSVVFSEACYGAHIAGRAVHDSMALSCLAGGASAFVGATGVAYGGLDGPLVAADRLAEMFWRGVRAGATSGAALASAKAQMARDAFAHHGYVDAEEEKAIYNFVLYGDPSLAFQPSSKWAEDAMTGSLLAPVEWAGPAAMVGTSPVRPHTLAADTAARSEPPPGLVDHVRQAVARRLPEFGSGEVRVEAAPVEAVARAAAHGGRPASAGRRLVVTLTKALPTGAGSTCSSVVRVTVDSRGTIRRVAVSR